MCMKISTLAIAFLLLSIPLSKSHAVKSHLNTDFQDIEPKYIISGDTFSGICVDILRALNNILHSSSVEINFPVKLTPVKRVRLNLRTGSTDLHCGSAKTTEREKKYAFSKKPLYQVKTVILGRIEDNYVFPDIDALIESGARIISVHGTNSHAFLASRGVAPEPIVLGVEEGLELIRKHRADLLVYHDIGLKFLVTHRDNATEFKIYENIIIRTYYHWMMYHKDLDPETVSIVDSAIDHLIASGQIDYILESYK